MFSGPKKRRGVTAAGTRHEGFFLGNSTREDRWRLYVTRDLGRYLEFPKRDTLDAKRLGSGRIAVWLRAGVEIEEHAAQPVGERFLTGEFRTHLGRLDGTTARRLLLSEAGVCGGGSGGGDGGGTVAPQVTCPKPQCNDSIKDPGCR